MKFSIFKTKRTVQVVLVYKRTSSTTAISRKVVGKSARDNPERYCGGFEFTVLQRNLRECQRPWTYVCEC